ncbi:unnamed protein product [Arctogadus glacialis]
MTTCGPVTKSLLLLAVVVALTGQGSAGEGRMGQTGTWVLRGRHENQDWKVSECCTRVTRKEITETIVDFMVQLRNNHCVNAIIFKTESGGLYCCKHDEPWVRRKVRQLRGTKIAALASTPSLLKLITSSSSPPPLERTTGMPSTYYTVQ